MKTNLEDDSEREISLNMTNNCFITSKYQKSSVQYLSYISNALRVSETISTLLISSELVHKRETNL